MQEIYDVRGGFGDGHNKYESALPHQTAEQRTADRIIDSAAQAWMLEPGKVQLLVGGSSAELPLRCETEL